ncbi:hypothetical protein YC2023_121662 [Brassica napus]
MGGDDIFFPGEALDDNMHDLFHLHVIILPVQNIEDQDVLPPEIVEIVGKTYGFGFSDDDNNMIGGADVSTAMKVWNLNDIMWKRIKSLHQMSTYSRKKQCTNDEGDKNKSG